MQLAVRQVLSRIAAIKDEPGEEPSNCLSAGRPSFSSLANRNMKLRPYNLVVAGQETMKVFPEAILFGATSIVFLMAGLTNKTPAFQMFEAYGSTAKFLAFGSPLVWLGFIAFWRRKFIAASKVTANLKPDNIQLVTNNFVLKIGLSVPAIGFLLLQLPILLIAIDFLFSGSDGSWFLANQCKIPSVQDYYNFAMDSYAKGALIHILDSFNVKFSTCPPKSESLIASSAQFLLRTTASFATAWIAVLTWQFIRWLWKLPIDAN